jgi:hypothetical protein
MFYFTLDFRVNYDKYVGTQKLFNHYHSNENGNG